LFGRAEVIDILKLKRAKSDSLNPAPQVNRAALAGSKEFICRTKLKYLRTKDKMKNGSILTVWRDRSPKVKRRLAK
jgi:hypothetical protein